MKLESAQIRNFRMLENMDMNIDFEDVLSLVIGKNNSGKTSFLLILEKFLSEGKPEFAFEDFSIGDKLSFQDNTTVKYKHENTMFPEDYNGLRYLNLFAVVFNLRIKLDQLSKSNRLDEKPAPLNLLFIEEPEAHTHPQLQYIFITNIKRILEQHRIAAGDDFPYKQLSVHIHLTLYLNVIFRISSIFTVNRQSA